MVERDQLVAVVRSQRRRLRGWAAISLLGWVASGCAPTLAGKLVDPGGSLEQWEDTRINLTKVDPAHPAFATVVEVDHEGTFRSPELTEGIYVVEVLAPGYEIVTRKVHVPKEKDISIRLSPNGMGRSPAISVNLHLDSGRGAGQATLAPPKL